MKWEISFRRFRENCIWQDSHEFGICNHPSNDGGDCTAGNCPVLKKCKKVRRSND